jgi:leucyl/phenylalanyl-tRNA--protein transferase
LVGNGWSAAAISPLVEPLGKVIRQMWTRRFPTASRRPHNGGMPARAIEITATMLLRAYGLGLFPMAQTRDSDRLFWLNPERRGILPLDQFHLPRRLFRTVRSGPFEVSCDRDFPAVIAGCATPAPGRRDTWINAEIERLFTELFHMGHVHTVECRLDGELVGGLYGVVLGGAFFGESMFSFVTDASKVALVHLVARLRLGGFVLLDTQFITAHLMRFGAREIRRDAYKVLLAAAVELPARWLIDPDPVQLAAEIAALAGREAV